MIIFTVCYKIWGKNNNICWDFQKFRDDSNAVVKCCDFCVKLLKNL